MGKTSLPCIVTPGVCLPEDAPVDGFVLDRMHVNSSGGVVPAFGGFSAVMQPASSTVAFSDTPSTGSLVFDSTNWIQVQGANQNNLPTRDITVEAWVYLSHNTRWGGIIGYVQDNGAYEKGWVLTYHNTQFGFALSADGTLPYLYGGPAYQQNTWYHVVGTWDGVEKKLYVNGTLVATQPLVGTAIDYPDAQHPPPATVLTIGQYRDINEHYPLIGRVRAANIYPQALTAAQISARYTAGAMYAPCQGAGQMTTTAPTVVGATTAAPSPVVTSSDASGSSGSGNTPIIAGVVVAAIVVVIVIAVVVLKVKAGGGGGAGAAAGPPPVDKFGFENPAYEVAGASDGATAEAGYHDVNGDPEGYMEVSE
eukprot:m.130428 g.130428  ORF g.130428 m.130428 type:complete len:366 (+) comp11282_c0_seq6:1554-2651(+)